MKEYYICKDCEERFGKEEIAIAVHGIEGAYGYFSKYICKKCAEKREQLKQNRKRLINSIKSKIGIFNRK